MTPVRRTAKRATNLREQTNDRRVSGSDSDKSARPLLILLSFRLENANAVRQSSFAFKDCNLPETDLRTGRLQPFGESPWADISHSHPSTFPPFVSRRMGHPIICGNSENR